ncbi:disease susceptibility protein LOV1-like [Rhodamnia argentea]|uniref:Disease susceptibility protein LOV1-like n=1 Tax=Rhodamnia argentea TaxID=178133 RepID=A0A8B8NX43_9MYRT|nr:disease susceptibility protein LOV1-like [Rhodamnia argentea]
MGRMLSAREVGTSPLGAGRIIVASSPSNLTQPRKMNNEFHILGRENLVNKLVEQLTIKRDDGGSPRVISVVGEEAVGKTALVRSVYNRPGIKNHFDCFAWVRVGHKPDPVHLMVDLLNQLRVSILQDVDRKDEEELSSELQRVLMECCCLIVLDDLCDLHLMDNNLIMLLAESGNRSRILVTTRNPDIPSQVDPWSTPLKLIPLNPEQRVKLLEESSRSFDTVIRPTQLLHLKEKIFIISGSSPAKILLLGGLLSATTVDGFTVLINGLPDHLTLQEVVRLSIDELPEHLKKCALHMTLFPKEYEIPTRRLFRLWSAEELVSSPLENSVTRVDAEKCFEDLVSRNIVRVARWNWDGTARLCRLPGMLYDVLYQMAKCRRFLKIYDCSVQSDKTKFGAPCIAIHRRIPGEGEAEAHENTPEAGRESSETNAQGAHKEITLAEPYQRMLIGNSPPQFGIRELHSYVSFNTMKVGRQAREIEELLKPLVPTDSTSLRVLDLEGVYKPLLPKEFGNMLVNLKYLGLRWTLLESLPKSVVRLSRLETLDLKYTNITQVPVSIWEVDSLQHLYMNEVSFDKSVDPQLHAKESLNCNIQTICGLYIGVESPMLKVLPKLTGLRKLGLTCHPSAVKEATKQICNLKMLESLRLRSKNQYGQPSGLDLSDMSGFTSLSSMYLLGELSPLSLSEPRIPRNLRLLTLSMSGLKEDPMKVLGELKCLTTLRLLADSYEGETLSVLEGTFPELRVLRLWKLENLTKWTIQAAAMPGLKDLGIKDCMKLKTIDGLRQIKTLEGITMVKVPDVLEQSIREMRPNVPILAKELVKCPV